MNNAATLYNASLSTMWLKNCSSLDDFCQAARRLGFASVELNYEVNSAALKGIDLSPYIISSLHEPCPADISVDTLRDNDWLISSRDEEKRLQGVAAIRRSIDLTRELGVRAIVVHAGSVQADIGAERTLRELIKAGQRESDEYQEVQASLVQERAALAGLCLDAVIKSLRELLEYAGGSARDTGDGTGIRLGIETRDHYMQIPLFEEMAQLLDLAGPERLGMVYDVGHARSLDLLGFTPQDDWLKQYGSRIVGCHLHDMAGLADHAAPGLGDVDFSRIAPYLPADAFRTLELRPRNTPEQVQAGLKLLAEVGCIQPVAASSHMKGNK